MPALKNKQSSVQSISLIKSINLLTPKGDQHLISPYNNTAELFLQVHENDGNDY